MIKLTKHYGSFFGLFLVVAGFIFSSAISYASQFEQNCRAEIKGKNLKGVFKIHYIGSRFDDKIPGDIDFKLKLVDSRDKRHVQSMFYDKILYNVKNEDGFVFENEALIIDENTINNRVKVEMRGPRGIERGEKVSGDLILDIKWEDGDKKNQYEAKYECINDKT